MESIALGLTCTATVFPHSFPSTSSLSTTSTFNSIKYPSTTALRSKGIEEKDLYGLPKEFYDDEWQAKQREKTKELHRRRQQEEEEEEEKIDEYREIVLRLKDYPEEDLVKAKKLVASFIRSAEEVEEKIEEAAEKGELDELVLLIIWNRLDLARRDDEKDAVRSLDLLYRRVEIIFLHKNIKEESQHFVAIVYEDEEIRTVYGDLGGSHVLGTCVYFSEILKREATPAMRLLNDLLNMHDGGLDNEGWLKACKKRMVDTFPREDPFSILVPAGFDIDTHQGPLRPTLEADDMLLRIDFVREVNELLKEVRSEYTESLEAQGLDPESVASRLKQQEKQRAIHQVESLLDLAINLVW